MEYYRRKVKTQKIKQPDRYSPQSEVVPFENIRLEDALVASQEINELVSGFNMAVADWDYIQERCFEYFRRNGKEFTDNHLNILRGLIRELIMTDVIDGIIENDDLTSQFISEAVNGFYATEEFVFRRVPGRMSVVASYLRGGKNFTEYDALLNHHKTPIIIESKISYGTQTNKRINATFALPNLQKKILPLYEMDRKIYTPVAFVVMKLKDEPEIPPAGKKLTFIQSGGIVTNLPISSEEYDHYLNLIASRI